MHISKQERLELNALSKEVFGTSSKWQKLVDQGFSELLTEEKEETVPPTKEGDEPTTRKVRTPVLNEHSIKQSVIQRHTVESVRELMLNYKNKISEIKAMIQKQQEEAQKAKEDTDKIRSAIENSTGSAKG